MRVMGGGEWLCDQNTGEREREGEREGGRRRLRYDD
jgi:hypothetical protein